MLSAQCLVDTVKRRFIAACSIVDVASVYVWVYANETNAAREVPVQNSGKKLNVLSGKVDLSK